MRPEREGRVAGVVLAAGSSGRMGTNKLLLRLGDESVLRGAVRRALAAGLAPVVVVLGHEAERARAELAGLDCRPVVNGDYASGMGSSLRAGIAEAPAEADAAVVVLADMPLVTAAMLAELVRRWRGGAARLVASRYGDVHAPPTLYDRALFAELAEAAGGHAGHGCGKQVLKAHRDEAEVVDWPVAALADLDVPADYERLRAEPEGR